MTTGTIEINDAGLRIAAPGEIRATSPGYALLDGDRLLTGTEARANAKLLPRWTNNRFWNQLGTEPISGGNDAVRHHADLAFMHLESVWEANREGIDAVVFAVPGFYSREQLGLLLGMARECEIPVAGVVDTSLAAAAAEAASPLILHLDLFLHRITLTVLQTETSLRHTKTVTITETGAFTLLDRWANIIAAQFIQTSRYDPMHQANSEQALFDVLPAWIAGRTDARSAEFTLDAGGTRHEASVSQEQLLQACSAVYPQIIRVVRDTIPAGEDATLVISDRFKGYPGLADSLKLINNVDLVFASAGAVTDSVSAFESHIVSKDGAVSHTTSLPVAAPATAKPSRPVTRPTHVLAGHQALAIGSALRVSGVADGAVKTDGSPRFTLFERGGETMLDVHADGVSVDGETVTGTTPVSPGNVITIDDATLTLITVR